MANKEEVIFKVKAELAGFKKSMEDLKKVAKDSSKNIEKAMSMDLTDEGSKAGKSFAKGMNKELKSVTNALKNELKIMSDKTYTIKVKLDSSSVDRIKRDLSSIEIRVSASASGRASSSMSNNANAPNSINSIMSATNSSALLRLTDAVNKAASAINSIDKKIYSDTTKIESTKIKIDPVEVNVDFATEKLEISAKNMADTISEAMNNSIDSIKKAFESSANEIRKAIEVTNKKPVGVVENVKRRTNPQQTEDLELSKAMIKKYEEEIQKLIELIAQLKALRKVRKNIESGTVGYKYVNDEIVKTESAIARVNSKIKEYKNYLGDNADKLSISFNRTNELTNQLRMNLQLLAEEKGFKKLINNFKNFKEGLNEGIGDEFRDDLKNLKDNELTEHWKRNIKEIKEGFKELGEGIKNSFDKASDDAIDDIEEIEKGLENTSESAEKLNEEFKGSSKSVKELREELDRINSSIKSLTALKNSKNAPSSDHPVMIDINKKLADKYKEYNETSKLLREALQRETDRDLKEIREYAKELEKANDKLKEVQKTASNSNTKSSGIGFGKFSVNIKQELEKAESAAKEARNAFDELSVTMDEAGDSSSKLGMNLQLLASNQGKFDKFKNAIKNAFSGIESSTSQVISKAKTLFSVFGTQNSHVATHFVGQFTDKMNQLKDTMKKVSASVKDIGTPIKKAFNGVSGIINKIISPIKRVTSGFKGMGNEAKVASGKVNSLTGSFKGLLGKLTMFFGVYEMFNLFKEGTKDAMKYEASIINLQMTYGDFAQELIDFANKQAVAFGISKKQVAEYGNIFSVIMRDANRALNPQAPASAISKQTVTMSQELIKSAGIIAGALGYETETVLEGLRSGILGSSEAVDQYGLNLKIANLEQSKTFRQVANGKKSWNDLTTAQQQYIIAQEIINQTTAKFGNLLDKNGNIMKTTASLHSQFLAQWQNTKLAIGNLGKVIWTAVVGPLTKVLAVMEMIFNYAAGALTAILESLGIHVDLAADLGGSKELENNLGGLDDTATDTSDAIGSVGDSAQDTAKDTEDAAKKIKRALAGFDQINVLSLGDDEEDSNLDDKIPDLGTWNPPSLTTGDFGVDIPEFTADTSGLKELLDKMKAIFKEFLEPFKAAWDELGDRWIAAWNRLKDSFKNFCDSLGDFLASVWRNGGKEFVQHMAEIALAVGIAAMEIGGTILDALAKLWKHLDPETNINTKGLLDALNEVSVKIRDLILDLNTHFESLMLNGGQDVLNALGDMFMNLGEAAVRGVGIVVDAIDGLLDHLDPATNKKTQGALGGLEYLFKSIGQFALGLTDAFETFMDNGGQEFLNNIGDIVMILIDMAATITGDLLNAITAFFDSWAGHVVITVAGRALELVSSILKGLLEILEPLTPIISAVVAGIGAFMVASKVVTAVTTIVSAFQSLGPILGIAKAGFSALWAVLAANPVAAVIAAIVAIGVLLVALYNKCEWFRDAVNKVFDRIREPLEKLKEAFSEIIESVVNIFQDFIDIIVGIFTGDGERVGKAVRDMIENVINIFKNLWKFRQALAEIAFNLILGLVEGIWECIKNLPKLLVGIGEFIIDFFIGLFGLSPEDIERIKQIGRDIIDGICEGVMGAINAIGDFFGAIGDAIKQGIDNITSAEWWSNLGKAIAQPFIDAKDFVLGLLGDIAAGVGEWFGNKIDAALEKLGDIKDFLSDIGQSAKEALNALREWASGIPEAIGNALSNLKTAIVEGPIGDLVRAIGDKLGEIKDVASERIGIAVENASEKWGELTEELSGMLDDFIERNKERWERIKQDTEEKVDLVMGGVIDKYTNMKDEANRVLDEWMAYSEKKWAEMKENIMKWLQPILDGITSFIEDIKEAFSGFLDWLGETISKCWNTIKEPVLEFLSWLRETIADGLSKAKDAVFDFFGGIGEAIADGLSAAKDAVLGFFGGIGAMIALGLGMAKDAVLEFFGGIGKAIAEGFSNALNTVKETLGNFFSWVGEQWDIHWPKFKEGVAEIGNWVVDIYNSAKDAVLGFLSWVGEQWNTHWDHFKDKMTEIRNGIVDTYNKAKDAVFGFFNWLGEQWDTYWPKFKDKMAEIGSWFVGIYDSAKEAVGEFLSWVGEQWNIHWDHFKEKIAGLGELIIDKYNSAKETVGEFLNWLGEQWNAHWDKLKEKVSEIGDFLSGIWDKVKDAWEGFKEWRDNILGILGDIGKSIVDAIVGGITDALGALYEKVKDIAGWAKDIGLAVIDALAFIPAMLKDLFDIDIFQPIRDKLNEGLDKLLSTKEFATKAISIGRFLIEGLFDGIKTTIEGIGTFLSGVGDIVIGFFKDIFGIHSPSTVFAELGGYLIEGLAQGITDSIALLENVFSGVSDAISGAWDTIKTSWSEATEYFSDIWQSINDTFGKIKDVTIEAPKILWDTIIETASKTVDKVKETVEKFKADLPKPSVVWDSIETIADRTISNVKTLVERFKAKLPKPELAWNDLKTTLTDALNKLKETISKFKWELPKPKLPSFSVSGGKAPWGFMGQGSLPSISVKWNAQGGIMNSPTIFGMSGNTLLGGGEAGAEAILPLDELWNRLDNSFQQQNQALSRAIASSNNGSNRPVNVVLKVNDIEMGKVVVNSLKSLSNHSGGSLDLPFNK